MRQNKLTLIWWLALTLSLGCFTSFASTGSASEHESRSPRIITLEEKMEKIQSLQDKFGLIFPIDAYELSQLLSYPRNYTLLTLMNIEDAKYDCPQCLEADLAFKELAFAYLHQQDSGNKVIFTTINYFNNGKQAFEAVRIYHYFSFALRIIFTCS